MILGWPFDRIFQTGMTLQASQAGTSPGISTNFRPGKPGVQIFRLMGVIPV